MATEYVVHVAWDAEARCWFVDETNVPGLATGADTMDELLDKLRTMVPELLALNEPMSEGPLSIPYRVLTDQEAVLVDS